MLLIMTPALTPSPVKSSLSAIQCTCFDVSIIFFFGLCMLLCDRKENKVLYVMDHDQIFTV